MRSLAGMGQTMLPQSAGLTKAFPTVLTGVKFASHVALQMLRQGAEPGEAFPTL